jgi:hypothetical protein
LKDLGFDDAVGIVLDAVQARFQLGSHQPCNLLNQYGLATRLKGSKAVEVQDQCLMPGHGLLVVVSKPERLDRNWMNELFYP